MLRGIRVLDLTNVLSGPYCTYQLALLGAEVIKIENPSGGDLARQLGADPQLNEALMGASFLAQNAGKKSVTLMLKDPAGVEIFRKLVKTADVVVENFRPGVMQRLGLAYDELKQINPQLIYCSISGFGQAGPLMTNPAYDQIVQGMSGVMSITGDTAQGSAPMRVGYPVCDTIGGITAAFSIVSALLARTSTHQGQAIDVSMLDATLTTLGWVVSNYLICGETPRAMGNQNMTAAPSGTFATRDGLINIAANKQEQFESLCRLLDRPELVTDPRFAKRDSRKRNRQLLNDEITSALAHAGAADWVARLNAAGIPAGQVLSVPEVIEHPQVASRNLLHTVPTEIPGRDSIRVSGAGFRLSSGEISPTGPPPRLGADTAQVLRQLGFDASELEHLAQSGII